MASPLLPVHRRAPRLAARVRSALGQIRRVRVDRVLEAGGFIAAVVLVLVEAAIATGIRGVAAPVALVLALVHAGSVPLAIRRPNIAAPLGLAAALALQALSVGSAGVWPWWPVLIVTQSLILGAVAARSRLPLALLHWTIALGASAGLAAWLRPGVAAAATDLIVFGAISAGVIVVALLGAQWRRVRSELLQERRIAAAESERRMLAEERSRIARELHDVVAHSLSLITVQTQTARFRHRDLMPTAVEEFERIGAQSRQALDEMRGLLRVLRDPEDDADLRPQPGLADLADLVAQAGDAGSRITLDAADDPWTDVGPVTGLAAYRIVQEGVSNALRHAPGAAVRVTVSRSQQTVVLTITNTVPPRREDPGAPGHGLVGMTERALSVGGRLQAGPDGRGGWTVRAVLPVHAGAA